MLSIDADLEGLARFFESAPKVTTEAARLAINTVAERGGMKLLRDQMVREIAFPNGYLNADRLRLRKAYNDHLEAVITARQRPTSLARFAVGAQTPGMRQKGVTVRVGQGRTSNLQSAFLMRLRAGANISDSNHNIGLAIRLKPGERIRNKRVMTQLGHNLYLLYGPSVDQVFRTVADDQAPAIAGMVRDEFYRQFTRLSDAA